MAYKNQIDIRMKENYEDRYRFKLTRRMPVIIRIDGKAFHSFTKGFNTPFDDVLRSAMEHTMVYLCDHIEGCKIGYTQSDEISLLLTDYDELESCAFFDYNIQKIASVAASMATMIFNNKFTRMANIASDGERYTRVIGGAMFDARCFNIPREEVTNYFFSRQSDAIRNSVYMIGKTYFSHKELQHKNRNDIKEMLAEKHNVHFEDYESRYTIGSCAIKEKYNVQLKDDTFVERSRWIVDPEIPIFAKEGREYIEKYLYLDMKEEE